MLYPQKAPTDLEIHIMLKTCPYFFFNIASLPGPEPGNADLKALPLVGEGGRASKTAFPAYTWEQATWGVKPPNLFTNSIIDWQAFL